MTRMEAHSYHDRTFEKVSYSAEQVHAHSFERCTFDRCDLSRSDLTKSRFVECTFIACDLTMAKLNGVRLQGVNFKDSKLLGVDLSVCSEMLFSVAFEGSVLDHAFLTGLNLRKTRFERCSMKGVVLERTDLSEAVLRECDLLDAVFGATQLRGTDLTTAFNFRIDPDRNSLKGARLTLQGAMGLLLKYGVVIE